MLALRLPPDIEKRLDALAKKTGRTKSYYAREAILRHSPVGVVLEDAAGNVIFANPEGERIYGPLRAKRTR